MPKQNPKHQKKKITTEYVRKKKKIPIQRRQFLGVFVIAAFAISIVSAVIIAINNQNLVYVEVGDELTVKYTLWITTSNDNWIKGEQIDTNDAFPVTMEVTAEETGLIAGFYDALLGQVNGSIQYSVRLEACVDNMDPKHGEIHPDAEAGDGWDDRYPPYLPEGRLCKSYGAPTPNGDLTNTRLIFYIEIVNIVKKI